MKLEPKVTIVLNIRVRIYTLFSVQVRIIEKK